MTIIDRYLLRQFLQNFVICLVSLTGVYVVFDAFTHMESFLEFAKGFELLKVMAAYYAYQSLFFFDLISAPLVLMSAMLTIAWIQRHHEMTALMAAGISRVRVAAPVIAASVAITVLAVVNREALIPQFKEQIVKKPSDLKGNVVDELLPQYDDASNILIRGHNLIVDRKQIEKPEFFLAHAPHTLQTYGETWTANLATFLPAKDGHASGYLLQDVTLPQGLAQKASLLLPDGRPVLMTPHDYPWLKANEAFLISDVAIDELRGGMFMQRFASTGELIYAVKHRSIYFSSDVRVMIHSRIVQPFLDITLLFLGLPLVLARDNRNVFVAIGMCVGLVAMFFMVAIACQQLGSNLLISPALASWAPLMVFVPAAVGMSSATWEK